MRCGAWFLALFLCFLSAFPLPLAAADGDTATLLFAGDVLLHRTVRESGAIPGGGYRYDHLFSHVQREIAAADLAVINQETLSAGEAFGLSGYPCFNAPTALADAIAGAGFRAVLLANNHAMDRGAEGLHACRRYYTEHFPSVTVCGVTESEAEEREIPVFSLGNIRVAILNYTYGTNGIPLPDNRPFLVHLLTPERARREIAAARQIADFVVVCPHWGTEYQGEPDSEQVSYAALFAEAGADLVVGTHPHVIQPIAWLDGKEGHRTLVYYSLGNFVSAAMVSEAGAGERLLGGMAKIRLQKKNGTTEIAESSVIPIVTQVGTSPPRVTVYPFSEYTPAMAEENWFFGRDSRFSFAACRRRFSIVFRGFLPA